MMISQQVQTLLAAPNAEESHLRTLSLLNSRFKSLDELDALDASVDYSLRVRDDVGSQVRSHADCQWAPELTEPS